MLCVQSGHPRRRRFRYSYYPSGKGSSMLAPNSYGRRSFRDHSGTLRGEVGNIRSVKRRMSSVRVRYSWHDDHLQHFLRRNPQEQLTGNVTDRGSWGSDTFGRYQSGIPTHRYGGPAVATLKAHFKPSWHMVRDSTRRRTKHAQPYGGLGSTAASSATSTAMSNPLAPFLGPISRTTHMTVQYYIGAQLMGRGT